MNASRTGSLGQLLILRLEECRWTASLEQLLHRYGPAGVFLSKLRSPDLTAGLLARITCTLDEPPLLWLDEEGGSVDPLAAFLPPLPSPRRAAERGLPAIKQLGELVGAAMQLVGFNINAAPLLDLATPGSEELLEARAFGSDPQDVARAGEAFVRGLRRHKVFACGKYFPGQGAISAGASAGSPVVGKPMTELWRDDLRPYRELLGQLSLVMMSHAAYKAYDFDMLYPATESASILQGLLRLKLRYGGLSVADLTRSGEAPDPIGLGERAVRSIVAGCDLLIVPGEEELVEAVVAGLENALASAKLRTGELDQSLKRLRATRKGVARPRGRIKRPAVDRLVREFESFSQSVGLPSERRERKPHDENQSQEHEPARHDRRTERPEIV